MFVSRQKKTCFSLWGLSNTGTGCPESLQASVLVALQNPTAHGYEQLALVDSALSRGVDQSLGFLSSFGGLCVLSFTEFIGENRNINA